MAFFVASFEPAWAVRNKKQRANQQGDTNKYAALVIEFSTGEILISDNPDQKLHPASLTKMMTLLLVFDALAEKRIRTTDYIRISNHAASMSPSRLGIRAGGEIRVDDAIRAISVKSANDIAVAMAEALAGSEDRFAVKMTRRAREIGMKNTQFVNASGLHSRFQISSARDMAILARYIIHQYPQYYRYFGLRSFSYSGKTYPNHNKLMGRYSGMDGMKTGYISQSGFNLVASAKQGERRLIGVVFGGRTARSRDDHMVKILDQAFSKPQIKTKKINVEKLPLLPEGIKPVSSSDQKLKENPKEPVAPVLEKEDEKALPPQTLGRISVQSGVPVPSLGRDYMIQIGAYQNRETTDRALYQAVQKLPNRFKSATPIVAPMKSIESGWLFRARFGNLNKTEAEQLCSLFPSCLVLSPEKF